MRLGGWRFERFGGLRDEWLGWVSIELISHELLALYVAFLPLSASIPRLSSQCRSCRSCAHACVLIKRLHHGER